MSEYHDDSALIKAEQLLQNSYRDLKKIKYFSIFAIGILAFHSYFYYKAVMDANIMMQHIEFAMSIVMGLILVHLHHMKSKILGLTEISHADLLVKIGKELKKNHESRY